MVFWSHWSKSNFVGQSNRGSVKFLPPKHLAAALWRCSELSSRETRFSSYLWVLLFTGKFFYWVRLWWDSLIFCPVNFLNRFFIKKCCKSTKYLPRLMFWAKFRQVFHQYLAHRAVDKILWQWVLLRYFEFCVSLWFNLSRIFWRWIVALKNFSPKSKNLFW